MNQGISILQGPHQVAQKSSSTTLPLSDASFTSLPSTSLSTKFMLAGLAFAAQAVVGGAAGEASAEASRRSKCVSEETFSVNNANARHPTAAIVQRIFMRLPWDESLRPDCTQDSTTGERPRIRTGTRAPCHPSTRHRGTQHPAPV